MGLREKKKLKLQQSVERETLRLIREQGYERTTVEQIAEAAEISSTTFYRYFSSKEDVILSGPYEQEHGLHFIPVPAPGQTVADAMRGMLDDLVGSGLLAREGATIFARLNLINQVPELRAAHARRTYDEARELSRSLAAPSGTDPDSLEVRLAAMLISGAVAETLRYWVDCGGEPDLGGLLAHALELIAPAIRF